MTKKEREAGWTRVQVLTTLCRAYRRRYKGCSLKELLIMALRKRRGFGFWLYIDAVAAEIRRLDQEAEKRKALKVKATKPKPRYLSKATEIYAGVHESPSADPVGRFRSPYWDQLSWVDQAGTLAAADARRDFDLPDD